MKNILYEHTMLLLQDEHKNVDLIWFDFGA
jgi:hypothetical protein